MSGGPGPMVSARLATLLTRFQVRTDPALTSTPGGSGCPARSSSSPEGEGVSTVWERKTLLGLAITGCVCHYPSSSVYRGRCASRGELLEENAQELTTTGVTTTIWHFHLESI